VKKTDNGNNILYNKLLKFLEKTFFLKEKRKNKCCNFFLKVFYLNRKQQAVPDFQKNIERKTMKNLLVLSLV